MKKSISEHESFQDILYIVRDTIVSRRRDVTSKIFGALSGLTSQHLSKNLQRLEELRQGAMLGFFRVEAQRIESNNNTLKTFAAGLDVHKQAIVDFIIYRCSNIEIFDDQWAWRLGSAIPKIPKKPVDASLNIPLQQEQFSVPDEFLCPISREVMDDPVTTSDGFTFERNAIERSAASSPSMRYV